MTKIDFENDPREAGFVRDSNTFYVKSLDKDYINVLAYMYAQQRENNWYHG